MEEESGVLKDDAHRRYERVMDFLFFFATFAAFPLRPSRLEAFDL
jgi:hypothetical protein